MDIASAEKWSQVKTLVQNWLASPVRVLLPGITILISVIFFAPKRWKLLISTIFALIICAYIILISPVGASLTVNSLAFFVPQPKMQSADAIVILGRGQIAIEQRTQAAAALFKAGRAPLVIVTATGSSAQNHAASLMNLGVPKDVILLEGLARTTEENALYTAPILKAASATRIILITDKPHMLRSMLTFQSFSFEVIPFSVNLPSVLPSAEVSVLSLREYAALLSYWLLGRFTLRSVDPHSVLTRFEYLSS